MRWRPVWPLVLATGLALAFAVGAAAQTPAVVVLTSQAGGAYDQAVQALRQQVQAGAGHADGILVDSADQPRADWTRQRPRVWVALGSQACAELAARQHAAPVLCALLPRAAFERVVRHHGRSVSPQFAALALDPGLEAQLALIQLALPHARRVGVLWGPESVARAPALRAAVRSLGLTLVEARGDPPEVLTEALAAMRQVDIILAQPDPQVFNTTSLQNILLTSFRAQVPVQGFSPAYVRAGALLSLHVTPAQVGTQVGVEVARVLAGGELAPTVLEPTDFEVSVNPAVAHALRLRLDAAALRSGLLKWIGGRRVGS